MMEFDESENTPSAETLTAMEDVVEKRNKPERRAMFAYANGL